MTVHNFDDSLARAAAHADAPWWQQVYEQAFPTLVHVVCLRADGWAQRAGIDRQLILADGKVLTVDEKVRDTVYDDFFIELWSSWDSAQPKRSRPGWAVDDDKACDYVAYAFAPTQTCYLMPYHPLRRVCQDNRKAWLSDHGWTKVPNERWTTWGVCVPIPAVLDAIRDTMVIRWA